MLAYSVAPDYSRNPQRRKSGTVERVPCFHRTRQCPPQWPDHRDSPGGETSPRPAARLSNHCRFRSILLDTLGNLCPVAGTYGWVGCRVARRGAGDSYMTKVEITLDEGVSVAEKENVKNALGEEGFEPSFTSPLAQRSIEQAFPWLIIIGEALWPSWKSMMNSMGKGRETMPTTGFANW